MPEKQLRNEFPGLIEDFYYINIKRDRPQLLKFKSDLKDYVEANFQRKLPSVYFDIKEELERQFKKHKKEIIHESEVVQIAEKLKLQGDKQDALEYLNTLGVGLRYSNIPDIILNPTWISNGILTIINEMQNSGVYEIHKEDMPKLFKGKNARRYNWVNYELLYKLMMQFELAFEMKDTKANTLLVPSILPDTEPDNITIPNNGEETLTRRYNFNIALSESIFPKYMHRNHVNLEQKKGTYSVWSSGMVLVGDRAYALVTKDTRSVEITTWGENRSDFLFELHKNFYELLQEDDTEWERDEIKLPSGFCSTHIIWQLYHEGKEDFDNTETDKIMGEYHLHQSFVSINKPKTTFAVSNAEASIGNFKFKK